MKYLLSTALCLVLWQCNSLFAQIVGIDSNAVFNLGEVTVTASRKDSLVNELKYADMQRFQRLTAASALNLLPGIAQSNVGQRNESMIYIHGFDLRQTPLFVDGVPVYIPYDGYVDLGRFTTFDLSKITVEKGTASVLYGPNTMGGAINLVSAKPAGKLDVNGVAGWLTGGYEGSLNVGTRQKHFYLQGSASKYQRDYFNVSDNFIPVRGENGGHRENAYNNDWKYSVKAAWTPNERNEFAVGFLYQEGKKGTPVYAGRDAQNSLLRNPRYWQWPYWNKQSIYFLSNSTFSNKSYLKTRFFHDRFTNLLESYNDSTYTAQTRGYAFSSYYNDYSFGGNTEYGIAVGTNGQLKTALHAKKDVHRENNKGEPVRTMADNTFSAGATYNYQLSRQWQAEGGASYNFRKSLEAQDYKSTTRTVSFFPVNDNSAVNAQLMLTYAPSTGRSFTASGSRMTRFATMKDRYSYRLGTAIPNPDLKAEHSWNTSLSYTESGIKNVRINAEVYASFIGDVIQSVSNVVRDSTGSWLMQAQNTGRATFYGADVSAIYNFKSWQAGANYSFIKRENKDNKAIRFIDVPEHKVNAWVGYNVSILSLLLSGEWNAKRYSTSYGVTTAPYELLNISAGVNVVKWITLRGGINNIFDKNYSIKEGYPEQGRNYFVKALFRFVKN